jgi:hypothetical protein
MLKDIHKVNLCFFKRVSYFESIWQPLLFPVFCYQGSNCYQRESCSFPHPLYLTFSSHVSHLFFLLARHKRRQREKPWSLRTSRSSFYLQTWLNLKSKNLFLCLFLFSSFFFFTRWTQSHWKCFQLHRCQPCSLEQCAHRACSRTPPLRYC